MTNNHRRNRAKDEKRKMSKRPGSTKADALADERAAGAAADEAPVPADRRKAKLRPRRRPAAAAAPATMEPVANQGLPGSGNTGMDLAAGQSLQEEADAWKQLPEVQQLVRDHDEALDAVYETLALRETELAELQAQTDANRKDFANLKGLKDWIKKLEKERDELTKKLKNIEEARQSGADEHFNFEVLKEEVARLTSELSDAIHDKHKIEAEKDALEGINDELARTIDDLEDDAANSRATLIDNAGLKVEIMGVHRDLEAAFSDMTKDLSFKDKFAYIHDHQQKAAEALATATAAATAGRPRIVSGASLHDELENASEVGSEPAPKEELSLSDITSTETGPIAAPGDTKKLFKFGTITAAAPVDTKKPFTFGTITANDKPPVAVTPPPKQPLSFSNISAVDTPPAAAAPPTKQPLSFSNISAVDTPPVAAPSPTKQQLGFSNISTVETSPVAATPAPKKPLTFSTISAVETSPIAPPAVTPPKKAEETLGFSDVTTVETSPIAPPAVTSPKKAKEILGFSEVTTVETYPIDPPKVKPQIKWRTKNVYVDVERPFPVTPWWMWLLFFIAITTCAGASAALIREKNIWVDANELASLRLMGAQHESWIKWIVLGVGDLLPSMVAGSTGFEMFG